MGERCWRVLLGHRGSHCRHNLHPKQRALLPKREPLPVLPPPMLRRPAVSFLARQRKPTVWSYKCCLRSHVHAL